MSNNRYFTLETENRKQFFQVPKQFMKKESKYFKMSSDSKLLYAILLDRNSLSISNNWIDEYNRVYFISTIENLMQVTGWGNQKVVKQLKELRKYDLLISVQKGQGKPSWHYLLQIEYEKELETKTNQQRCENHISRNVKITSLEMLKSHSNNTNINNTNINNNISSSSNVDTKNVETNISKNKEEEEKDKKDIENSLIELCKEKGFKISRKDLKTLIKTFSADKVNKAITTIALLNNDNIKNFKSYLLTTLNNTEKNNKIEFNIYKDNSKKTNNNANFTQRDYTKNELEELEKQLLGL